MLGEDIGGVVQRYPYPEEGVVPVEKAVPVEVLRVEHPVVLRAVHATEALDRRQAGVEEVVVPVGVGIPGAGVLVLGEEVVQAGVLAVRELAVVVRVLGVERVVGPHDELAADPLEPVGVLVDPLAEVQVERGVLRGTRGSHVEADGGLRREVEAVGIYAPLDRTPGGHASLQGVEAQLQHAPDEVVRLLAEGPFYDVVEPPPVRYVVPLGVARRAQQGWSGDRGAPGPPGGPLLPHVEGLLCALHVVNEGLVARVGVGEARGHLPGEQESALRLGVDARNGVGQVGEELGVRFVMGIDIGDEGSRRLLPHARPVLAVGGALVHRGGPEPGALAEVVDGPRPEQGPLLRGEEGQVFVGDPQSVAGVLRILGGLPHQGEQAYLVDDRVVYVSRQDFGDAGDGEDDALAPGDDAHVAQGVGGRGGSERDGQEILAVGGLRIALGVDQRVLLGEAVAGEGPRVGKLQEAVVPVDHALLVGQAAVAVRVQAQELDERRAVLGRDGLLARAGEVDVAVEAVLHDVVGTEEVPVAHLVVPGCIARQRIALLDQQEVHRAGGR